MPRGCWGCERRPLVYSDPVTKDIPPDLQSAVAERYELRRVLGQGGMATVYLAYDGKHRREVALKVLVPGLAAFLGVERFLREIQTAARLTHPHILALYDSGEAGGGLLLPLPFLHRGGAPAAPRAVGGGRGGCAGAVFLRGGRRPGRGGRTGGAGSGGRWCTPGRPGSTSARRLPPR